MFFNLALREDGTVVGLFALEKLILSGFLFLGHPGSLFFGTPCIAISYISVFCRHNSRNYASFLIFVYTPSHFTTYPDPQPPKYNCGGSEIRRSFRSGGPVVMYFYGRGERDSVGGAVVSFQICLGVGSSCFRILVGC